MRDDIQAALKAYYQSEPLRYLRVPVLDGEQQFPIAESYINLALVRERVRGDFSTETAEASLATEESHYQDKVPLPLPQLFLPLANERSRNSNRRINKVLITGRAGIGKSTLCHYLANQWSNPRVNAFSQFDYVFWVSLKSLEKYKSQTELSLEKWFLLECFSSEQRHLYRLTEKKVADVIFQQKHRCLLLLDGYDEVAHLHQQDGVVKKNIDEALAFPNIVVTSRPYQINAQIAFDRKVENVGFTDSNVKRYLQRHFADQQNAADMWHWIQRNPILKSISYIPLNLFLLCYLGDHGYLKPSGQDSYLTITGLYRRFFYEFLQISYAKENPGEARKESSFLEDYYAKELRVLDAIAFEGFANGNQLCIAHETLVNKVREGQLTSVECIVKTGLLRKNSAVGESESYLFLHLTFQEYCAARHLVSSLQSTKKGNQRFIDAINFILENKYHPRYSILMTFVMGLSSLDKKNPSIEYIFDALFTTQKDLIGLKHVELIIKMLEQAYVDSRIVKHRLVLLNEVMQWILASVNDGQEDFKNIIRTRLAYALQLNPRVANDCLHLLEERHWMELSRASQAVCFRCYFFPLISVSPIAAKFFFEQMANIEELRRYQQMLEAIEWEQLRETPQRLGLVDVFFKVLEQKQAEDNIDLVVLMALTDLVDQTHYSRIQLLLEQTTDLLKQAYLKLMQLKARQQNRETGTVYSSDSYEQDLLRNVFEFTNSRNSNGRYNWVQFAGKLAGIERMRSAVINKILLPLLEDQEKSIVDLVLIILNKLSDQGDELNQALIRLWALAENDDMLLDPVRKMQTQALSRLMEHQNDVVRVEAVLALINLGYSGERLNKTLKSLSSCLRENSDLRLRVVNFFSSLKEEQASTEVISLLRESLDYEERPVVQPKSDSESDSESDGELDDESNDRSLRSLKVLVVSVTHEMEAIEETQKKLENERIDLLKKIEQYENWIDEDDGSIPNATFKTSGHKTEAEAYIGIRYKERQKLQRVNVARLSKINKLLASARYRQVKECSRQEKIIKLMVMLGQEKSAREILIPELVERLSENIHVRAIFASVLVLLRENIQEEIIVELQEYLNCSSSYMSVVIAGLLIELEEEKFREISVAKLLESLKNENSWVRSRAAKSLVSVSYEMQPFQKIIVQLETLAKEGFAEAVQVIGEVRIKLLQRTKELSLANLSLLLKEISSSSVPSEVRQEAFADLQMYRDQKYDKFMRLLLELAREDFDLIRRVILLLKFSSNELKKAYDKSVDVLPLSIFQRLLVSIYLSEGIVLVSIGKILAIVDQNGVVNHLESRSFYAPLLAAMKEVLGSLMLPTDALDEFLTAKKPRLMQGRSVSFFREEVQRTHGLLPLLTCNQAVAQKGSSRVQGSLELTFLNIRPENKGAYIIMRNVKQKAVRIEIQREKITMDKSFDDVLRDTLNQEIKNQQWHYLDFSGNKIRDISVIASFLKRYVHCRVLQLSHNQITKDGLMILLESIRELKSVRYLLLDHNWIDLSRLELESLKEAEEVGGLIHIDLSMNYIRRGRSLGENEDGTGHHQLVAADLLVEHIPDAKERWYVMNSIQCSLVTHSQYVQPEWALLDFDKRDQTKKITPSRACVGLLAYKTKLPPFSGHAFLLIEYIDQEYGQRALIKADLTVTERQKIDIRVFRVDPDRFLKETENLEKIHCYSGIINSDDLRKLEAEIFKSREQEAFKKYRLIPGKKEGVYNCVKWAVEMLKSIGIDLGYVNYVPPKSSRGEAGSLFSRMGFS